MKNLAIKMARTLLNALELLLEGILGATLSPLELAAIEEECEEDE